MPRDTHVDVTREWTQLTANDVSAITFLNSATLLYVKVTADSTQPSADSYGIPYTDGQGERAVALSELAPGVTSPKRVWAKTDGAKGRVWVSHG